MQQDANPQTNADHLARITQACELADCGLTARQIAKQMGTSTTAVRRWLQVATAKDLPELAGYRLRKYQDAYTNGKLSGAWGKRGQFLSAAQAKWHSDAWRQMDEAMGDDAQTIAVKSAAGDRQADADIDALRAIVLGNE